MQSLATAPRLREPDGEPRLELLLADDDARIRELVVERVRATLERLTVLEAEDGAQAVQLGLQRRPSIALLDVHMPRLGGLEAAITLRELRPQMRLALHTADAAADRGRVRQLGLLLFDKLELDETLRWLALAARAVSDAPHRPRPAQRLSLECSVCGYGAARPTPPERCPMCHGVDTWIHAPWRPFSRPEYAPIA